MLLVIDTTADRCAIGLFDGRVALATLIEPMARGHAERLAPLIDEALAAAQVGRGALTRIGVCEGPGGFTGARIGVAAARGMALALRIPAVGVDRFEALAAGLGGALLVTLSAPGGATAFRRFRDGAPVGPAALAAQGDPALAPRVGEARLDGGETGGSGLAALAAAAERKGPDRRPAPLYLRPPDAEPPRTGPAPLLS
mgnify:CR=1 FL=1